MTVDILKKDGLIVLRPDQPRLDETNKDELFRAFEQAAEAEPKAVILDLSGVDYLNSAGLFNLVRGYQAIGNACEIHLCGLNSTLDRLIRTFRYDRIFTLHSDLNAALKSLA